MDKLKGKLWEELEEIERKPKIGPGDLELAHKLTDTIKNIDKICMLEEEEGHSQADAYDGGNSYANRGKHWVRGHYSRDGGYGQTPRSGNGHYGRNGNYSRGDGRSEMLEHLEMALDAADERDREDIKRFMRQLKDA